jgi:hypothetical protein
MASGRKVVDLTNKQYGKLTVKELHRVSKNGAVWKCECECGRIILVRASNLRSGSAIHCRPCSLEERRKRYRVGNMPMYYWRRLMRSAQIRGIEATVTPEEAWSVFVAQNGECALTGRRIGFTRSRGDKTTASLDRKDSSQGYTLSNVQWVHKTINAMKSDLDENEFVRWCARVGRHKRKPANVTPPPACEALRPSGV